MRWTHHDRDLVIIGLPLRTSPGRAASDIPAHRQAFLAGGPPSGEVYAVYWCSDRLATRTSSAGATASSSRSASACWTRRIRRS